MASHSELPRPTESFEMTYDYAPRLAQRAAARRRRSLLSAFILLCLPALSWHAAPKALVSESPVVSLASR